MGPRGDPASDRLLPAAGLLRLRLHTAKGAGERHLLRETIQHSHQLEFIYLFYLKTDFLKKYIYMSCIIGAIKTVKCDGRHATVPLITSPEGPCRSR